MSNLTALDIHFLIKELQLLIGSKVEKVYRNGMDFLIQLHVPRAGGRMLRISLPGMMYLTEFKGEVPESPDQFTLVLRKYLGGARLVKLEQREFERIVQFDLSMKDETCSLFVELFSKGNIILCQEGKIKAAVLQQKWKDRTIRGGIDYVYPKREHNPLTMDESGFVRVLKGSDKESVVKSLAMDFGFGGRYAEEICTRARIDKNAKDLDAKGYSGLFKAWSDLRSEEGNACCSGTDAFPLVLSGLDCVKKESYNAALAEVYDLSVEQGQKSKHEERQKREIARIEKVIESQEATIKTLEESIGENQRKAELLFESYATVNDILTELKKAKTKFSWKEIKERLKGHPVVKSIDEKTGQIVLNLDSNK
jgi:predicted ribosome quality control (RQC) complex YloA/Tae2 family protein